jgi:hypothetical protein
MKIFFKRGMQKFWIFTSLSGFCQLRRVNGRRNLSIFPLLKHLFRQKLLWEQVMMSLGRLKTGDFPNFTLTQSFYHVIVWALAAMKKKSRFLLRSFKRVRRVGADETGVIEVRF